jgi:hypothetical protein
MWNINSSNSSSVQMWQLKSSFCTKSDFLLSCSPFALHIRINNSIMPAVILHVKWVPVTRTCMDAGIRISIFAADKNCIRALISNKFAIMGLRKFRRFIGR